jgi:hypothetical protein
MAFIPGARQDALRDFSVTASPFPLIKIHLAYMTCQGSLYPRWDMPKWEARRKIAACLFIQA